MGSSISLDKKYGNIYIQTLKPRYLSGEQVDGFVHLNLVRDYPSNVLHLIISGEELVQLVTVHHHHVNGSSYTTASYYNDKHELLNYTFPLYSTDQIFKLGHYYFPFSFHIPHNLPASCCTEWTVEGYKSYAKTVYSMWAGLHRKKKKALFVQQELGVDQKFEISISSKESKFDHKIRSYCCKSIGNFMMGVYLDKDSYVIGESANLIINVDNSKCKSSIDKLKVRLIQEVKAGLSYSSRVDTIHDKQIQIDASKIKKGEKRIDDRAIVCNLNLQIKEGKGGTSNGMLVKSGYLIEIKPEFKACMYYNVPPTVYVPIRLFNQPLIVLGSPFDVANWRPQVMDPYICAFTPDRKLDDNLKKELGLLP